MKADERFELIEAYVSGNMNEVELALFKEQLQSDEELAAELKEIETVYNLFELSEEIEIREKVEAARQQGSAGLIHSLNRYVAVAALFVVLLGMGWFIAQQLQAPESLLATHFEPYPNVVTIRGDQSLDADLKNGMVHYSDRDWQLAQEDLQAVVSKDPKNTTAAFYLGLSYLAEKRSQEGIDYLKAVADDPNGNAFQSAAKWYLALAHIDDSPEIASSYLNELVSVNDTDYGQKASELLNELE